MTVTVPAATIPDLVYEFSPRCGDILPCSAGRRWDGELGGGIDYGGPFGREAHYPGGAVNSAPAWVTEDGTPCLEFDGIRTYVNLPHEALPRGAFTLTFEIKCTSSRPQVLFRSYGLVPGPLLIELRDGKLCGTYTGERESLELRPELDIPLNAWSRVTVTYDLTDMRFDVDGRQSAPIPVRTIAPHYTTCVFGGHTKPGNGVEPGDGFFEGYLRALHIVHAPPN